MEPRLGDAIAIVATTLLPTAVVGLPVPRAMSLPGGLLDALLFRRPLARFVAGLLLSMLRRSSGGGALRWLSMLLRLAGSRPLR
jgi:hypothetical protein